VVIEWTRSDAHAEYWWGVVWKNYCVCVCVDCFIEKPGKGDLNIYKGFFCEKHDINFPDFYYRFQQVARIYKEFFKKIYFHI
jgi:hypothetical protein